MLEAMSVGCTIIASNTAPVKEVITHNYNGVLTDFFDYQELASKVSYLLDNPDDRGKLAQKARSFIQKNYNLDKILPQYITLLNEIKAGKRKTMLQYNLKPTQHYR
jgi:glycosyltransferase involved in cell wall biosynthesis